MATERRSRRYQTNGNVAYQPEYRQRVAERPVRKEVERIRRPRIQPRERVTARPNIQVRPKGTIAPFAVAGFLAILVCAFLLVASSAQLATANKDIVNLRSTLSDLQDQEQKLQAQYELAFDLDAIEGQFISNGSMIRSRAGQTVYLDMLETDSVVYYEDVGQGLSGLLRQAREFLTNMLP